jgi:hypothetical protein
MELVVDVAEGLYEELLKACRESLCQPRQFVSECVEVILASRRLPHVYVPLLTQGARPGRCRAAEIEEVVELEGYPVHGVKL